jgi:hypothetical protein
MGGRHLTEVEMAVLPIAYYIPSEVSMAICKTKKSLSVVSMAISKTKMFHIYHRN